MEQPFRAADAEEHRFWLTVMGEHARFVFYALSPAETGEIERVRLFIKAFDALLAEGENGADAGFAKKARKAASDFYRFLLQHLALALSSRLSTALSASLINHMVSETAEYLALLDAFPFGKTVFPAIHHHMLWLFGSREHAAAVGGSLDPTERETVLTCGEFERQFDTLYLRSVCLRGFMRTELTAFPALDRLSFEASDDAGRFRTFLEGLRDSRKSGEILGSLPPEAADHMAREEDYYLRKIQEALRKD